MLQGHHFLMQNSWRPNMPGMSTPLDNPPGIAPPGILQNHQIKTEAQAQLSSMIGPGPTSAALPPFSAPPLELGLPPQGVNPGPALKDLLQQHSPAQGPAARADGNPMGQLKE